MAEQALFFTIGFLVALLAAVAATPIFSRRAMRLAAARARMQAPLTEKHAAADRDALRAAHAVELARLNHRLAIAENDAMALRATVGRQTVQIIALEAAAAERERVIFDIRSEMDKRVAEHSNREMAAAASWIALHDLFAQRDRARSQESGAKARLSELEAEENRDRARIAILVARAENLEELLHSAQAAKERAEKSVAELRSLMTAEKSRRQELEERLRRLTDEAQKAAAKGSRRAGRADLEMLKRENETLRARNLALASARDTTGDAALRTSIEHLGREINRLFAWQKDVDQDSDGPKERSQQDATANLGPSNNEARGPADAQGRRAADPHALDR